MHGRLAPINCAGGGHQGEGGGAIAAPGLIWARWRCVRRVEGQGGISELAYAPAA